MVQAAPAGSLASASIWVSWERAQHCGSLGARTELEPLPLPVMEPTSPDKSVEPEY